MRSLADDLSLTAGHDEEALLVLALLHEEFVNIYLFCLERVHQTVQYLVVELREQRDSLQVLRRKRGLSVDILNRQTVVFTELHLRAIYAERAAADLHPGEQLQKQTRSDRAHLRGGLGSGRQSSGGSSGHTALKI